jgi:ABC-type branched-subunit amino acid transport system ATPase component
MRGCSTVTSDERGSKSNDACRPAYTIWVWCTPMSLLEIINLHSGYGANEVIHGIDFSVEAGQIVTILGPNGCGKSTFVRTLLGYVRTRIGHITFDGNDITQMPPTSRVRLGIGYVPQLANVFRPLTVRENLEMGGYSLGRAELAARLEEVGELFPILRERRSQRAGTLSGGERQLLAMARAMMVSPRLLCLDEPSAGLSPLRADEVFEHIRRIAALGVSMVVIEQDARRSLSVASLAYVLVTGRVAFRGQASAVLSDERIRTAYLGGRVTAMEGEDSAGPTLPLQ